MKRPKSIEGRIRYYGIALAELAAQAYLTGVRAQFEMHTKPTESRIYAFFRNEKGMECCSANLDNDLMLDWWEEKVEAYMIAFKGQEVLS